MAPMGQGEAFGVVGELAVVDDGVRRRLWEGDEAGRCHWRNLELTRLEGLLVRQHGVARLVVHRGHLAQEQGQDEEPVPCGHDGQYSENQLPRNILTLSAIEVRSESFCRDSRRDPPRRNL